jgi:hypothetical protein
MISITEIREKREKFFHRQKMFMEQKKIDKKIKKIVKKLGELSSYQKKVFLEVVDRWIC